MTAPELRIVSGSLLGTVSGYYLRAVSRPLVGRVSVSELGVVSDT